MGAAGWELAEVLLDCITNNLHNIWCSALQDNWGGGGEARLSIDFNGRQVLVRFALWMNGGSGAYTADSPSSLNRWCGIFLDFKDCRFISSFTNNSPRCHAGTKRLKTIKGQHPLFIFCDRIWAEGCRNAAMKSCGLFKTNFNQTIHRKHTKVPVLI